MVSIKITVLASLPSRLEVLLTMALCDRLKERFAEAGELRVQLAEAIVEDGVG